MIPLWKVTANPESEDDIRYRGLTSEQRRRHREVEKAAFLVWIEKGSSHGHDLEDWLDAERRIAMHYPAPKNS